MNIFEALYSHGSVYAQRQDGAWVRVKQARTVFPLVLWVKAVRSGKWFVCQQWRVI